MVSLALATGSAARAGGAVPALVSSFPDETALAGRSGARFLQCTSPPGTAKAGPFVREVRMIEKMDGVAAVAWYALRAWPMCDRLRQGGLQLILCYVFPPRVVEDRWHQPMWLAMKALS
jgi:hypothetical protein